MFVCKFPLVWIFFSVFCYFVCIRLYMVQKSKQDKKLFKEFSFHFYPSNRYLPSTVSITTFWFIFHVFITKIYIYRNIYSSFLCRNYHITHSCFHLFYPGNYFILFYKVSLISYYSWLVHLWVTYQCCPCGWLGCT